MHLSPGNFLTHIRNMVTGGGRTTNGQIKNDAGFLKDLPLDLQDLTNDASVTNAVKQTITIPVQLADFANAQTWKIALPFAGTLNSIGFRTGKPASTAAKAATLQAQINGTGTTGGAISLTSANQATTGTLTAGSSVTALNTFTAGQTIEVLTSSVTAFVEGDGYVEFNVTNTDLTKMFSLSAAETNLRVISAPASTTTIGTLNFVIPRDYDEATDTLTLKIGVASAGATDTPTLTAAAYRKRPGSNIATITASVTGKDITETTAVSLSSAEKVVFFGLSQASLKRDDQITVILTSAAHTTDAVLIYFVEAVYRSTLVSYNETDDSRGRSNYGNPLR